MYFHSSPFGIHLFSIKFLSAGAYCERKSLLCDSNPCRNGGRCEETVNGYVCKCPGGFTGLSCETTTEVDSHCKSNGCQLDEVCAADKPVRPFYLFILLFFFFLTSSFQFLLRRMRLIWNVTCKFVWCSWSGSVCVLLRVTIIINNWFDSRMGLAYVTKFWLDLGKLLHIYRVAVWENPAMLAQGASLSAL